MIIFWNVLKFECDAYFGDFFFFSSRRRHTRFSRDWSSDVCSSDLSFSRSCVGSRKSFLACRSSPPAPCSTSLADHAFSMPVGRISYLHLEPMGFIEFLDALGDRKSVV